MQGDFVLNSLDGEVFGSNVTELDFWTGCEYTNTFSSPLSFTKFGLSGTIDLHHAFTACGSIPGSEDFECDRTWEILGMKQ